MTEREQQKLTEEKERKVVRGASMGDIVRDRLRQKIAGRNACHASNRCAKNVQGHQTQETLCTACLAEELTLSFP